MSLCLAGYASLVLYAWGGSAVSVEAQAVTRAASALRRSVEGSQALFGRKEVAISQLCELANECSEPGWDGCGAHAIDPMALQNAEMFLRALPEDLPTPEFAPEPDGSISLDWIHTRHRLFSLGVGPNDRLAYAWLDGTDKGHGVARFDGLSVPQRVLAGIQLIMG